jgi:hypothetical protein
MRKILVAVLSMVAGAAIAWFLTTPDAHNKLVQVISAQIQRH